MEVEINWNKFESDRYRPLATEEVPDYKPGTIAYDDYWDEQDRRCIDGYKPNRFMPRITGEHYFYLNMCRIKLLKKGATRKTYDSPFYRELDRRLFNEIRGAKKGGYGLIVGKPRRVGLSYVGSLTALYELLFYEGNNVGVAAGQEDKAQDFYEKVKDLISKVRPEYRSGTLVKNSEEIKFGYLETVNKQKEERGLLSSMYMKTMYAKPTGFEGKSLALVIFEEAGLFEDLIAAYKSTEPCFKEGAGQFGSPLIYGTGGDITKGSKGYMEMWKARREIYNLKRVLVTATDYFPGDGIPDKKTGKTISFFDFKTGQTNSKAAYSFIMEERKVKEGSEGFIKHIQSYPLKEEDIFIKNSGGLLNRRKLAAQMRNQDNCPFEHKKGRLEWTSNDPMTKKLVAVARSLKEIDKIHFSRGSKLKFVEDEELGTINKILDPIYTDKSRLPYNPDIGGCDSYDDQVAEGTGSLGATIIYRCFYGLNNPSDLPIAYILDRGTSDSDDEFYSQTLRLSIYYNIELMIEYTKITIVNYFKDVGATKHLKRRPDLSGVGYNSKAQNEYGLKMSNAASWTLTLRLLRQEVNMNYANYWFMDILQQLSDYGEENSDLGSALGMALVSKLDMFQDLTDGLEESPQDDNVLDNLGYYDYSNGEVQYKTYKEADMEMYGEQDDIFSIHNIRNVEFDPEYDLEGQEKIDYESRKLEQKSLIDKNRKEVLDKYDNDIMAFAIEDYMRSKTDISE